MFRNLLLAGAFLAISTAAPGRAPVLVELFTSEGCSSCPPADRLLQQFEPQAIVLSEHVDYWDHLGWRDPYSSHAFTTRQEAYSRALGAEGPYTPQMVVDGAAEFVGSDAHRAAAEVEKAAGRPHSVPRLTRISSGVHVEVDGAPSSADVFLAIADDSDGSQVAAGENKGRNLHHVAVLRSLRKIGAVKRGASFRSDVEVAPAGGQRIIVFLQESGQARVFGAGLLEW